jgi:sugar/nucleoside kinase (ribokinase family)
MGAQGVRSVAGGDAIDNAMPTYDVVAIGNALVDVLSHESYELVGELGLEPGSMTLVEAERVDELYTKLGPAIEMSGGSAANTIAGVASFGGSGAFIGRVADDTFGHVYVHDLQSIGVHFASPIAPAGGTPTGRCLVVVTPDAQRTMSTFLGAGSALDTTYVDAPLIADAQVLYLEGYLWDQEPAMAAFRAASDAAHAAGRKVALSLSDSFCVLRHRDSFLDLIAHSVDILFANEPEITALYEVDTLAEAVTRVAGHCEIAALTHGATGSTLVTRDAVHEIAAHPVDEVIDTTGAGDLYAAGFLYGLTHGHDLPTCGALASLAAAEIISHVGARPETPLATLAETIVT